MSSVADEYLELAQQPTRLRQHLNQQLHDLDADDEPWADSRPAAVLVPVVPINETPHLLFMRRPETMKEHSGQISFPGGKIEEGESFVQAAQREAFEELGIDAEQGEILGRFPGIPTITNYWVHPVVCWFDDLPKIVPSEREVAEYFFASVPDLLDPSIYTGKPVVYRGRNGFVDYFNYPHPDGETKVIWGATGRLLHQLFSIAFEWSAPGLDPDFEPDFV